MATPHELDTDGTALSKGQNAENLFAEIAQRNGYSVRKSSSKEDRFGHFDFWIEKAGRRHRVEVKAAKGFKILADGEMTDDFVLVEFVGVNGYDGWLYGKADYVAFERPWGFLMVDRMKLRDTAEKKVLNIETHRREDMLRKLYSRRDRQDTVSALLSSDIPFAIQWKK